MHEYWIIEIIVGLLAVLGLQWGSKKLFAAYRQQAEQKHCEVKLDEIILPPLRLLLWIFGFSYVLFIASNRFGAFCGIEYIDRIRDAAIIGMFAWLALRWKKRAEERWLSKGTHHRGDPSVVHALGKLLTALICIITVLIILYILGVNVLPLLAFGGIGAAAIGFAAKDVIGNFFGGLMLYLTRPFIEGDEIIIQKENIQGVVEDIGWYLTSLRDGEKRSVYLPNALFSEALVINCSRMSHRKIFAVFSIEESQANKVEPLVEEITKRLSELPILDHNILKLVTLDHIGGHGLQLSMEVYTKKTGLEEYRKAKQEVLLTVLDVLRKQGIASALPKTIVKIDRNYSGESE